jgi:hypothetical protein
VAEKILRVNESLDGISRLTFQMSVAALPHDSSRRLLLPSPLLLEAVCDRPWSPALPLATP